MILYIAGPMTGAAMSPGARLEIHVAHALGVPVKALHVWIAEPWHADSVALRP